MKKILINEKNLRKLIQKEVLKEASDLETIDLIDLAQKSGSFIPGDKVWRWSSWGPDGPSRSGVWESHIIANVDPDFKYYYLVGKGNTRYPAEMHGFSQFRAQELVSDPRGSGGDQRRRGQKLSEPIESLGHIVDTGPVEDAIAGIDIEDASGVIVPDDITFETFVEDVKRTMERIIRSLEKDPVNSISYDIDRRRLGKLLVATLNLGDIDWRAEPLETLYEELNWFKDEAADLNGIVEWQQWLLKQHEELGGLLGMKGEKLNIVEDEVPFAAKGGGVIDQGFDENWTVRVPDSFWTAVPDISKLQHDLLRDLVRNLKGDEYGWMRYLRNPGRSPKLEDRLKLAAGWVKKPPAGFDKKFKSFAKWYGQHQKNQGHFGPRAALRMIEEELAVPA